MKKKVTVNAYKVVKIIVAFCLFAAIIKVIYIAVSPKVNGVDLISFAEKRNEKKRTLFASRGTIYDKNGEALALSVNSYTIIAYLSDKRTTDSEKPQHVVDKVSTAKTLASILNADEDKIFEYLNKEAYQVEFGKIGRNITESIKNKIEDAEMPGIDFIEGTQRYYKMGDFASYIVGYAKTSEEGEIYGELGIESYFNKKLSGVDGYTIYQSDIYGYALPNKKSVTVEAENGDDVYLTIDSNIQIKIEDAISKFMENNPNDWTIISIMDAKTGAIVASSTRPSFNPNDLNTLSYYYDRLIASPYEPGSTMKTFTWATSMEEGLYNGDDIYTSGKIEVADATIKDFNDGIGWGNISYNTGYINSSNVAATKLSAKIGTKKLLEYYNNFGFGKKTGVYCLNKCSDKENYKESAGIVEIDNKVRLANASFGQGIMVTPIQILQAYSAITNDGVIIKPYLVDKIIDDAGNITYESKRKEVKKVISKETANKMKDLMYKVNYEGLAKMWQPQSVIMGIKTGTAQIANTVSGGYEEEDVIYSIAGIFPNDDPKYIIYVASSKLKNQVALANMVTQIVDDVASYAKITKNEEKSFQSKIIKVDNYKSQILNDIIDKLSENVNPIVIGDGKYIKSQYPLKGAKVVSGSKIFLITTGNNVSMPDLKGWSLSDVKTYARLTNLKLEYSGYGYVDYQSIEEGTNVLSGSTLTITLK